LQLLIKEEKSVTYFQQDSGELSQCSDFYGLVTKDLFPAGARNLSLPPHPEWLLDPPSLLSNAYQRLSRWG